ncbi:NAD(+) synthase [Herbaspirillum sp. YR522]|uniref:NAD(+) synthase n=1 Tax=Herbaspirillum sp. YR522 TaxID=1144342 RepID=UPI00026FA31F|nr:NAD(+) synthase [Herbaspirillum sp. YR522]EJM95963.1 NAD+ synthetase [Herbaspirillum sp. YR522]
MPSEFFNLYNHGFARVAVAVPQCKVADPAFNAARTIELARQAAAQGAVLVSFPELGLSAYSCEDLFQQKALLDGAQQALQAVVEASIDLPAVLIVGLPLKIDHQLFNCAAVVANGRVHGVVPKTYLPNYSEFYEARQFSPADCVISSHVRLGGQDVPVGSLLFDIAGIADFRFHVEICEDVWVPIPPSSFAALAGATVLVNLSASNVVVGKSGYRHQLVSQQSARCMAAYLYSSAGNGESTTDVAWDGQALICENGELLAQSERFGDGGHVIYADVDLERLSRERFHQTSFGQSVRRHADEVRRFDIVTIELPAFAPAGPLPLRRQVARFPYVPASAALREERCAEVYHIQVQALVQRLSSSAIQKVVIGVSGGLDSTHALLVCAKAMDKLGLPRSNILAYTMPGFATSGRTLDQAHRLMRQVGCSAQEIDIRPSCELMLKDLGHPYARGEAVYDITFENVQAGERTNHLFRLANHNNAIVIGTGDLSELALGWCTYGVGDHMSHYNVNASVPKTLITHLVRWVAESSSLALEDPEVLMQVLDTEISPELVPGASTSAPGQRTQDFIGPYELQDFNLYYILRYGFTPAKVAFLAHSAWHDSGQGHWPDGLHGTRNVYTLAQIKKNLGIFVYRFFKTSQFKRSCVPNAPKVGSGGSLSPRGDWRAPSDSEATLWLENLQAIPENEDQVWMR